MGKKLLVVLNCLMLSLLLLCSGSNVFEAEAPDGVHMRPPGFDFGTVYANSKIEASCRTIGTNLSAVTSFPDWIIVDYVSTDYGWFYFHVNTTSTGEYSGAIRVATEGDMDISVNLTVRDSPAPRLKMLVCETPFGMESTDDPLVMKPMTKIIETGHVNVSYTFDFLPLEDFDLVLVAEDYLCSLSQPKIDLLKDYVSKGGSVMVCADAFYGNSIEQANKIINDFGLNMRDEEYGFEVTITEFASHPITAGVEEIRMQRPSPVEIVSNPNVTTTILAHPSGLPPTEGVLAISEDNGKVIVLGDSLWWNQLYLFEAYNNSQIFLKIFDYVADKAAMVWSDPMEVNDIAISKDGEYLAVANNTGVYCFASYDPNPRWWFLESDAAEDFLSVAISADGEYVVAGQNNGYILYFNDSRVTTGPRLFPTWKSVDLYGPVERGTVDMSEDGEYVAVGGTGVSLYYYAGCTGRGSLSEPASWSDTLDVIDIRVVRISPDGRYIAAGGTRWPSLGFVAFYKNANSAPYPTSPDWEARSSLESLVTDLALSDDGYAVVAVNVNYSTLHYWADATNLGGDPYSTWTCGANFLSVDMSYDGNKVLGGGVITTSVHFWADSRTREGVQTEDWVKLESLHVLDTAMSRSGGLIAVSGMFGSDDYRAYFLRSDGTIIGSYVLPQFSPIVAMSGDGFTAAIGGPGGDSLYVFGLTLPKPVHNVNTGLNYTSIQEAIDAPETLDGHTISVDEGTYYEHVVVHKSVTLNGKNAETTVIDGGGVGNVVEIVADDVLVSGFTIQHSGVVHPNCGIWGYTINRIKVTYNILKENFYGIWLAGSEGDSIHSNIVVDNLRYGISLVTCNGCYVYDNVISNNTEGIYLAQSSDNTIHDNDVFFSSESGIWLHLSGNNLIYGNNASNNHDSGLRIGTDSNNNTVYGNTFSDNYGGVDLYKSRSNIVYDNFASNGVSGIYLWESSNSTLFNNILKDNMYGFGVRANTLADLDNSVNTSNTIDGKPIYYLKDRGDIVLDASTNAGAVYLIRCNNVTVKDLTLTKNTQGILLWETTNSRIENVTVSKNVYGILLNHSKENIVFHDNFVQNVDNAYVFNSTAIWDNGMEGNYWSNYTGTDSNNDGIGDSSYEIDVDNTDKYPLMGMFHSCYTYLGYVNVISNSTMEDFEYVKTNSTIIMHVTNTTGEQTQGFCRLTIPHDVLRPPYNVTINGNVTPYTTIYENTTLSIIYFSYEHSTLEIHIVPEFAQTMILLFFVMLTLIVCYVIKRQRAKASYTYEVPQSHVE